MFRYNQPKTKQVAQEIQKRQFLSFFLGNGEYGVDVLRVQEIAPYGQITPLANTPNFVKGICNLRGMLIPIIDLRIIFNLPTREYNEYTVMIILNIGEKLMGLVVDSVSDVIDIPVNQLRPSDQYAVVNADLIEALGNYQERVIVLLDAEKIVTRETILLLESALAHLSAEPKQSIEDDF